VMLCGWEGNPGLAESNGSLPPGRWLRADCLYSVHRTSPGPNAR